MQARVKCHAGHKADQRPQRFFLGEHRYEVVEVLDQWYDPDAIYFRIRADDGKLYILRHRENPHEDSWTLESFRRALSTG